MKRVLALILIFALESSVCADIIDATRRVTWEGNVGIPGGIPSPTVFCADITVNIPGSGLTATANDGASDASALAAAVSLCPAGQVIQFPAGTFNFPSGFSNTKGVVIRGAGAGVTTFIAGASISFSKGPSVSYSPTVLYGTTKGSTSMVISATNGFDAGVIVSLQGGEGSEVNGAGYEDTWTAPLRWQTVQITSRSGTTVNFTPPILLDMDTNVTLQAIIYQYSAGTTNYITYGAFEDFTLQTTATDAIQLNTVAYCWLKDLELDTPKNHCLYLRRAFRCEIFRTYMHDASINGSGGGYGVTLENGCTGNLIHNNIAKDMTGSFQVNEGSSGNVFAYNYVPESDYFDSAWTQPDFQNHLPHPVMNLWEGNVGFMALFDDIHGSSSHHTVFRNRLLGYQNATINNQQYCVGVEAFNPYVNVVGNVLGTPQMTTYMMTYPSGWSESTKAIYAINYDGLSRGNTISSTTLYIHGNWDSVTAGVVWDAGNADHTIPNSLYTNSAPAWFGDKTWPPIDITSTNYAQVPAVSRWVAFQSSSDLADLFADEESGGGGSSGAATVNVNALRIGTIQVAP